MTMRTPPVGFDRPLRRAAAIAGLLAGSILTAVWPSHAGAAAIYGGFLKSSTTITDILDGIAGASLVIGGALPVGVDVLAGTAADPFTDSFTDPGGTATASASATGTTVVAGGVPAGVTGPTPGVPAESLSKVGDGVEQFASGTGSAHKGFAVSDVITDGVIRVTNGLTGDIEVLLDITYEWDIGVSAGDPLNEFAAFEVLLEAGIADLTDPSFIDIPAPLFGDGTFVATVLGPPLTDILAATTVAVSFVAAAGATVDFAVFNDIVGEADSVPEPATGLLLAIGLAGLGLRGRRHDHPT